ncbi:MULTISPECIES: isocitrate lyase/PEP mutase family protein [Priestia]|jgi:2-methylisocitrate lyase-like PEP mutase family enzyme|uniref:isocitrate lyase/PEP mutase family protein n=1 Tax=Priestia aryabhattai TaxID=412384 RepID=UPI00187350D6|nr:isocitrate lyase/phosphoenolpyruvate mutase family protein [Priestia aryabhattai]MBE5101637.1 isocitrate lyase/phosphoenolpyruvate mutase family protein [Priestia aryabhattai]
MSHQNRSAKFQQFQQLHNQSSTFVLPNAWDASSARIFQKSGFKAIGTTSAGIATSLGYSDGENLPFEKMVEVLKSIVNSVNVPVSADIEAGYGTTVEEVIENVRQVILAGAVGINLEDGTGNPNKPILDVSIQVEKIAAIKELSQSLNMPLFVNARTDFYWLNIGNPLLRLDSTLKRVKAYEEAGADCIFIPGVVDIDTIKKFRQETSCPINLLVGSDTPSLDTLSKIGIERISSGSAPFRATITLLKKISEAIMNDGNFKPMIDDVVTYGNLTELLK